MKKRVIINIVALHGALFCCAQAVVAWEHHPLVTEPVVATMPEVAEAPLAEAVPLEAFLLAVEEDLAELLAREEAWARSNLSWYAPRPDALAFEATGNAEDVRDRFFRAIRINPNTKTPLYLAALADEAEGAKRLLDPGEVSNLEDTSWLSAFDFTELSPGELASPVDIVATASNEPDYGMDVGLFTDNGTDFGQVFGFGVQAFGNPALDYGSQAPFHMGFYHEARIVFLFAPFLKESYPEHRIHLFKSLSEFAFRQGCDYWGWRFMGWGLHTMADLSMPYHTTVLPGYSTLRMLWINLLDMLGFSRLKDNAVQLVSNRHMAIETYQGIMLARASRNDEEADPTIAALRQPRQIPPYTDSAPRKALARSCCWRRC